MVSQQKLIVANWKSNLTPSQASAWIHSFSQKTLQSPYTIVICPPYPLLEKVHRANQETGASIKLGVQDLSAFPTGSYTGEVCAQNLSEYAIHYAILGHSERRLYCHETANDIAKKIEMALQAGITPIVCVDKEQVQAQLAVLDDKTAEDCIFAYEDPKHIGTGIPSSMTDVYEVLEIIQEKVGPATRMLYGGSANHETAKEFLLDSKINGLLVGSASLSADTFSSLTILSTS